MDIVFLHGLRIDTVIGVYDWEREITQTLTLDLDMASDVARAAATDAIADALDYNAVAQRVTAFVAQSRYQLVETLAEDVAALIMKEFGVPWLRLRVNKRGAVENAGDLGVLIERGSRN